MRAATIFILVLLTVALAGCDEQECMAHCPDTRQLVCGTDDLTYDNPCQARCASVEVQYPGQCTGVPDTIDQD